MNVFQAGDGINATKVNSNFAELKNQANTNEASLTTISNTALLKNGSNITQTLVNKFNEVTPTILSNRSGTISLSDNTQYYLTLSGNGTISLPTVSRDSKSHTIILIVAGGTRSLNLGTTYRLASVGSLDGSKAYQVMYIYNKLDNNWYYCIGQ